MTIKRYFPNVTYYFAPLIYCRTTNMGRKFNTKEFDRLAVNGKEMRDRCRDSKLHWPCTQTGDALTLCLTPANVDDRNHWAWKVFTKVLCSKVFSDKGYIKQDFSKNIFNQGICLVHGLK